MSNWEKWSPWAKLDPNAKNTFGGAPAGAGATFAWEGNRQVAAEFTFKPEGNQTVVTWSMFGHNNFVGRAIHLVVNMDTMVGGQFEEGLANMRAAVATAVGSPHSEGARR